MIKFVNSIFLVLILSCGFGKPKWNSVAIELGKDQFLKDIVWASDSVWIAIGDYVDGDEKSTKPEFILITTDRGRSWKQVSGFDCDVLTDVHHKDGVVLIS
jgi:hypothetical protein